MKRNVAVIQSHYVPWAGFFDLIGSCSDVVILDSVNFSKNSFFNRNRLTGPNGDFWITIPVATRGRLNQSISQVVPLDNNWVKKHIGSIKQSLSRAPHYEQYSEQWLSVFEKCSTSQSLSEINLLWLNCVLEQLNLKVTIHIDSNLNIRETEKTERLIAICRHLDARTYRTGPRGLNYLDVSKFSAVGIGVQVIEYGSYYPYRGNEATPIQPVSILDNIANLGAQTSGLWQHKFLDVIPNL